MKTKTVWPKRCILLKVWSVGKVKNYNVFGAIYGLGILSLGSELTWSLISRQAMNEDSLIGQQCFTGDVPNCLCSSSPIRSWKTTWRVRRRRHYTPCCPNKESPVMRMFDGEFDCWSCIVLRHPARPVELNVLLRCVSSFAFDAPQIYDDVHGIR